MVGEGIIGEGIMVTGEDGSSHMLGNHTPSWFAISENQTVESVSVSLELIGYSCSERARDLARALERVNDQLKLRVLQLFLECM
jgi:hypothetical protein